MKHLENINEFFGRKKSIDLGKVYRDESDDQEYLKYMGFINKINEDPQHARKIGNHISYSCIIAGRIRVKLINGVIYVNDDLSAPSVNVTCAIKKDNKNYRKALRAFKGALSKIKN